MVRDIKTHAIKRLHEFNERLSSINISLMQQYRQQLLGEELQLI